MTLRNHLPTAVIIEHLKAAVPSLMKDAHVPGLSLSLIRDAQIVWSGAWGVKQAETEEPVTIHTIFQAASLSKPLFAYAVLSLVQRGSIELDRPVTCYLPTAFVPNDPLLERITVRMVLSHLTGWPNWREDGQPLVRLRAPGEHFGYSGEGFGYLQQAVECVTGQPLETFMQQSVFARLGMSHSSYLWGSGEDAESATGHDHLGKPLPSFTMDLPHAAASLQTTPSDYARFLCALLEPSAAPGTLSLAWREEMLRPQVQLEAEVAWGLGWGLQNTKDGWACWHSGDNPGFKNFTLAYPQIQIGMVIMTNGDGGAALWEPLLQTSLGGRYPLFAWIARQ
ncbi:class A beta-lactamase-related serine hydrolase [Ktedonosporobacter rubrisoli]|uniref:Class A beta-lactamase-related serine hydrolase n=1 Tax=Ktedonosporobacter rubrisoli TaxID=2509675 RepID=A0A4P6JK93_KTERU|nr:serine hydrolase domain-containing protein [Ktedonosporobacter rubrisoli]QBD75473.1 class A beta-lactamase-related serine hydrolase [Ktedonosporobacter rubrisoli]